MSKKKPVKYETFWVVYSPKRSPALDDKPSMSRATAINNFLQGWVGAMSLNKSSWMWWYRRGYRCKKVGVMK